MKPIALLGLVLFSTLLVVASQQTGSQPGLIDQTSGDAARKSAGCVSAGCHVNTEPMHVSEAVRLGCSDCHGGNPETRDKNRAHVLPSDKEAFPSTANAVRAY